MVSRPKPGTRADYTAFSVITTRWLDNDMYGHMNNAMHYQLFDTAVNGHLIEQGVLDLKTSETVFLVVETGCVYHGELAFPDVILRRHPRRAAGRVVGALRDRPVPQRRRHRRRRRAVRACERGPCDPQAGADCGWRAGGAGGADDGGVRGQGDFLTWPGFCGGGMGALRLGQSDLK